MEEECVFCKIINKEVDSNIVYENDKVMCILDTDPINKGHILILPKEHLLDADDMDRETANDIMKASQMMVKTIKKVFSPHGYSMMQNGGTFNEIGHYHMHVFPRYKDDGFGWIDGSSFIKEIAELRETHDKLKQAIKAITEKK